MAEANRHIVHNQFDSANQEFMKKSRIFGQPNIFFHKCDEKNRIYNQQMMVIIKKGVGDKIQKCEKTAIHKQER